MKTLLNYEEILTDDGSTTLFSKLYEENCHSTSGARVETQLHYIQGCKIDSLSSSLEKINILEVGFGTGIGFEESLKVAIKNKCFLNFVSFEIDHELIENILEKFHFEYQKTRDHYQYLSKNYSLTIFHGNARNSILKVKSHFSDNFHAIYQDAFSPKRNAILWTTEWFKELKNLASPNCILSTYSSSSSIRKSLISAGWYVTNGEKFGPKRSSTRANLIGPTEQMILDHLERSPAIEITDNNFESYKLEGSHEKNLNL